MVNLGECYSNAEGVLKKHARAVAWYRRAADMGDLDAYCNLGKIYSVGRGVSKDIEQAFSWYQRASELGHAESMFKLGQCYAKERAFPSRSQMH
jgi:TPR repeat protein